MHICVGLALFCVPQKRPRSLILCIFALVSLSFACAGRDQEVRLYAYLRWSRPLLHVLEETQESDFMHIYVGLALFCMSWKRPGSQIVCIFTLVSPSFACPRRHLGIIFYAYLRWSRSLLHVLEETQESDFMHIYVGLALFCMSQKRPGTISPSQSEYG